MGSVYVAEQDKPVRRKVALKIIKPGMGSREVISRFESERQALALMDHPHIARVLDAGTTDNGLPYFVMELVKGLPITEHCDAQKLTTRDRLELFLQVCQAVQHAHQKGIIHRDIKPSNVIVAIHDVRPVVKVIDFGVAKAIGQQLTDNTLYTAFSQMVGTPLYMSPEQAGQSGLDIDTRSDVYSLGVLLYELLTGYTPFESETLKQAGYDEMRRIIREVEPPRPSARISTLNAAALSTVADRRQVDPRKLSQQLHGELDWIVMKAMEKDRNRRYVTASALALDIQHYLNDEPVQACPPSISYRLHKIARRYRAPLAIAGVLLMTMVGATAVSIRYAFVADAALSESESERFQTNVQRARAESALANEEKQRRIAAEQHDRVKRNLYIADMRLAANDLNNANIGRLHETLTKHIPREDDSDLRSWEWYFLQACSHQEESTFAARGTSEVDWSSDGTKIAAVGKGSGIKIWNAIDGSLQKKWDSSTTWNRSPAWSPDNRLLAWGLGGNESGVRIWDSESGETRTLFWNINGGIDGDNVFSVSWCPNGRDLATGQKNGLFRIWDVENEGVVRVMTEKGGQIWGSAWSPDGKFVATAISDKDRCIRVWDVSTGSLVLEHALNQDCHSMTISHDGKYLVLAAVDGNIDILDLATGDVLREFNAHTGRIVDISANPKKPMFASVGEDGVIHCWSLPNGEPIATFYGHDGPVQSIAWNPEGTKLVTGSLDDTVRVWQIHAPTPARSWQGQRFENEEQLLDDRNKGANHEDLVEFQELAFENSHARLIQNTMGTSERVPDDEEVKQYLRSAAVGLAPRPKGMLRLHSKTQSSVLLAAMIWSQDQSKVVFARPRAGKIAIELWAVKEMSPKPLATILDTRFDIAWSPDNTQIAMAGSFIWHEGMISVFDAKTAKISQRLIYGGNAVSAVAWNPSGSQIASGTEPGLVCLWRLDSAELIASSNAFHSHVSKLSYSPDGKRIAAGASDGQVQILDAEDAGEILRLDSKVTSIRQLAWSPNGKKLACLRQDHKVDLWDATNGYEYESSGRYQQDIANRTEAVRAQAHTDMMRVFAIHMGHRKFDLAIALTSKALQENVNNAMVLFARGQAFHESKRYEEAIVDFDRVLNIDANHQDAWYSRGLAEKQLGRHSDAKESFKKVLQIKDRLVRDNPDNSAYLNTLAWLLGTHLYPDLRDPTRAVELAREAVRLSPWNGRYIRTLGFAQYSAGDWQNAITTLNKSAELQGGGNGYDWFFLAMPHWQIDQKDEARTWYDKAVEWMDENQRTDESLLRFRAEADELLSRTP